MANRYDVVRGFSLCAGSKKNVLPVDVCHIEAMVWVLRLDRPLERLSAVAELKRSPDRFEGLCNFLLNGDSQNIVALKRMANALDVAVADKNDGGADLRARFSDVCAEKFRGFMVSPRAGECWVDYARACSAAPLLKSVVDRVASEQSSPITEQRAIVVLSATPADQARAPEPVVH